MSEFLFKDETYNIIGACMEVYNQLGKGFNEIIYKDALEIEFQIRKMPHSREIHFPIKYKTYNLPHHYFCDFLLFNKIILEVKAIESLSSSHLKQTMNYLAAAIIVVEDEE